MSIMSGPVVQAMPIRSPSTVDLAGDVAQNLVDAFTSGDMNRLGNAANVLLGAAKGQYTDPKNFLTDLNSALDRFPIKTFGMMGASVPDPIV